MNEYMCGAVAIGFSENRHWGSQNPSSLSERFIASSAEIEADGRHIAP